MKGNRTIKTDHVFTQDELVQFMSEHWDVENYGSFEVGKPTKASIETYIMLPVSDRHCVIVYPRKAGSLFVKDDCLMLSVTQTSAGFGESIMRNIPTSNLFFGGLKLGNLRAAHKDRTVTAEEALEHYYQHLRTILDEAGFVC